MILEEILSAWDIFVETGEQEKIHKELNLDCRCFKEEEFESLTICPCSLAFSPLFNPIRGTVYSPREMVTNPQPHHQPFGTFRDAVSFSARLRVADMF
jgi:hypothetical protein